MEYYILFMTHLYAFTVGVAFFVLLIEENSITSDIQNAIKAFFLALIWPVYGIGRLLF